MDDAVYRKTMARAIRLLAAKQRSKAELTERLSEKADSDAVEKVIRRLEEIGYLNDERFAASFASGRIASRPLGPRRVRSDLQRRKVTKEVANRAIDEAYQETSEETLIDRAIAKRVRMRGKPRSRDEAHKLFAHLVRQGFGFDLIMRKIRAISSATDITEES
ncbi:MAG: RecX family transcriptional regulator [Acidobacteriota bacterium]